MTAEGIRKAVAVLVRAEHKAPRSMDGLIRSWLEEMPKVTDPEIIQAATDWAKGDNRLFPRATQMEHLVMVARAAGPSEFWEEPDTGTPAGPGFDFGKLWREQGVDV